jgi:hypothetical protein
MTTRETWLSEAAGWAAWAQTGDDGFSEFRELLPKPGRATLDLGCGEGLETADSYKRALLARAGVPGVRDRDDQGDGLPGRPTVADKREVEPGPPSL